jgi:hypothetical protein
VSGLASRASSPAHGHLALEFANADAAKILAGFKD